MISTINYSFTMLSSFIRVRTVAYRSFSTSSVPSSFVPPSLPRSDLSYRALLRNLRILQGLRPDSPKYRVIITGYDAHTMAKDMHNLEPCIEFDVVGDSVSVDIDRIHSLKGKRYDSIIVSQPYHTLPNKGSFQTLRETLHPEEGTLGFVWTRAPLQETWTKLFTEYINNSNVTGSKATTALSSLPLLRMDQTPMIWFDDLDITQYGLKPVKHRKFVEKLQGTCATLLPLLRVMHDNRLPLQGNSDNYNRAVEALYKAAEIQATISSNTNSLSLDLHAFHTAVVPSSPKK